MVVVGQDFREIELTVGDAVVRGYATRLLPEELPEAGRVVVDWYERYYVAHTEDGDIDELSLLRRLPFVVLHAWTIYLESPVDRYTNAYGEILLMNGNRIVFL